MIAAGILAIVFAGLLAVFVNCILLNELNRNLTLAYNDIQAEMEQVKNTAFGSLDTLNGTTFDLSGFVQGTARGRIVVSDETTGLKRIRITACFMSRNRLIGNNINSCTTSPVELVTLIAE